jgi:ribosome-associated protein
MIYNLSTVSTITDYFLITSGSNERQVQAICDEISKQARDSGFNKPTIEGYDEGRWALVDFGNVIVHVFHDAIREFYRLEELWGHAPRLNVPTEFYGGTIVNNSQTTNQAQY